MPREARKKSSSNLYHVILRGINRQIIFEDDGDRHYFMSLMKYCKEVSGFRLHAFCLMDNHVHLLMEPAGEPLGMIFRRIGSRYVIWYNRKYHRTGHLFQDRYKCESVESQQYYMTVLRYIMQNPTKAGMESRPGYWRWSSFQAYRNGSGSITDTQYAIDLFGGRDELIHFVLQGNDDLVMDEDQFDWRLKDERAKDLIRQVTGCASASEFQELDKPKRDEYIRKLYLEYLPIRQISRLTGVPKTTVERKTKGLTLPVPIRAETPLLLESDEFGFDFSEDEIW